MEVVKMFRAADGSVHTTAELCIAHEATARLAPAVEDFVNKLTDEVFDNASNEPLTSGFFLDVAALPAFLVKHAAALSAIYAKALTPPKGRRKKGAVGAEKPARRSRPVKSADKPNATPEPTPEPTSEPTPQAQTSAPTGGDIDDVLKELG